MKILIILLLLFFSLPQEKNVLFQLKLTPLIEIPLETYINEDIDISLIEGLTPEDVIWVCGDIEIQTPKNLILNFKKPCKYVPHIKGVPYHKYTINIESY